MGVELARREAISLWPGGPWRETGMRAPHPDARPVLSHVLKTAIHWGVLPEGRQNPCRLVQRFHVDGRERFLSETEFARLGEHWRPRKPPAAGPTTSRPSGF